MEIECWNTIDCESRVRCVRFNVDGDYCMTCGSDKKIRLWNPYCVRLLKIYGGHGDEVLDVAASCDSSQLISGSSDKSVILWDVSTGQAKRRLRGHAGHVTCVKFNEDSSVVISGSLDNTVSCWDMRSHNNFPIQTMNDAKDCVTSLQVTDFEILTCSIDCNIRRYDLRNGKLMVDFLGSAITCVNLTGDGQCALVSCSDNAVRLIEKASGEMLGEYTGHKSGDYHVESSMSPDDTMVISGCISGNIYFWDLVCGTVAQKLSHTPGKVVQSLCTHPIKNVLISACATNIKIWGKPSEKPEIEIISTDISVE